MSIPLVQLRPMTVADLSPAAALHRRSLDHGLFPTLGQRFLERYLQSFLDSPAAIGLVAHSRDGAFRGFLVGTLADDRHYAFVIRRRGRQLLVAATLALLARPHVAARFLRTRARRYIYRIMRMRIKRPPQVAAETTPDVAVLTHVAVSPETRSCGVGTMLVMEFVRQVQASGATVVELVTEAEPAGAGVFYRKLGWSKTGSVRDREGQAWDCYRLDPTEAPGGSGAAST